MNVMDVCLSTDDNYAKFAQCVIISILENKAPDDELVFHILHAGLNDNSIKALSRYNVVFHSVNSADFAPYFNNGGPCKHITLPTLYRLALPSILPDTKRVLYLDCDLIVLKSLGALYNTELSDNQYAACVPDCGCEYHMQRLNIEDDGENFYFNAGVCLMDLDKIRRDNIEEKSFNYLRENYEKLMFSDQDVLNVVLKGHLKRLDERYNFISPNFYFSNEKDVTIAHFAGIKPWKTGFYNKYRELFWYYFSKTDEGKTLKWKVQKSKTLFMHKQLCQIFWYIKMYPLFMSKGKRRDNFMKIINKSAF